MKRFLKKVLISLLVIVLILGGSVGALVIYSKNYRVPAAEESIENTTGLVQAHGRGLYDAAGNYLILQGVNAGQILLQEGWMSLFSLEPLRNEDGSYVKDKDNNILYPAFAEEDFRAGIAGNPNLNTYEFEELMDIYRSCFFTEEDFRIIKEELGLNTIRLPIYYLNIMNEDLTLKSEEEAFDYIDWFISKAAEHELYVVLDLHGAPGSQNGYEHSGTSSEVAGLWNSEENIAATVEIWDYISKHYLNTAPELGKWIATYDILNEPTYKVDWVTTKECWEVFDRIYDTIRDNGDQHVITIEGCWDFGSLPNPADYGWENVQYEYHWYNWQNAIVPYDLFYAYLDMTNIGRDYEVPVYIGEFNLFEDKEAWMEMLRLFEERNYSWTVWNYKTAVTGWWTSSFGVYTCQMKAVTEWDQTKCNVATCTYEEFVEFCEKHRTENCATGTLYQVLKAYRETE